MIQLYAVGSGGDQTAATALLTHPVSTDASGGFNISGLYSCPSAASLVYVVSIGGDPGIGANNLNIAEMAALGPCGNLSASTFINITEVTTVASVYELVPFMDSYSKVAYGTDLADMTTAFAAVNGLANLSTGQASGTASAATVAEINTLADIIASCINSTGGSAGDGSVCGQLLADTGLAGQADTISALIQIFRNPSTNIAQLYRLISPNGPFQPILTSPPDTWNLNPAPLAATPVFSPAGGSYTAAQVVTIKSTTAGAQIHITTDGSIPTASSTLYSGALTIGASETVNAIAVAPGYTASAMASASYTITLPTVATPVISLAEDSETSQTAMISCATPGATIYYTISGSDPTTSSFVYTGAAIGVNSYLILKAFAVESGYNDSAVATATYPLPDRGIIHTFAGTGVLLYGGDGGPAASAPLYYPASVAVDSSGNVYIADTSNHRIRKVDSSGNITTVAGDGLQLYGGDGGPATSAHLLNPGGVAVDDIGNLYIADTLNSRIRKVDTSGIITTVAGDGNVAYGGDGGPATSAHLYRPGGVAVDTKGNVYVADTGNNRIRKVDPSGIITTVAGDGNPLFGGDGGPATSAHLNLPNDLAVDSTGILYIADSANKRIRKVTLDGIITTIAGDGLPSYGGDGGPATSAHLDYPDGVGLDSSGNVYIADTVTNKVRKVTPDGVIISLAGKGLGLYAGDGGSANASELYRPQSVAVDASGSIYVADTSNSRIRKITFDAGGPVTATPVISPGRGVYTSPQTVTMTSATPGAKIYYTIDGTFPTISSTLYSGPFTVGVSEEVNAIAMAPGYAPSAYASAGYTIP